jgi:hypothetical protein
LRPSNFKISTFIPFKFKAFNLSSIQTFKLPSVFQALPPSFKRRFSNLAFNAHFLTPSAASRRKRLGAFHFSPDARTEGDHLRPTQQKLLFKTDPRRKRRQGSRAGKACGLQEEI